MSVFYILSSLFLGAFLLHAFLKHLGIQKKREKQTASKKYPPRPSWSLPVFGHLLRLGLEPWKTTLEWKKNYGPVMSVHFGRLHSVVLNDAKSIRDAFNLPAASGRPQVPVMTAFGHGKSFMTTDGRISSEQRQFVLKQLKDLKAVKSAEGKIMEEVKHVIQKFGSESATGQPILISHTFQISTMNSVWSLLMGYRFKLDDPQLLKLARAVAKTSKITGIVDNLVLFMPIIGRIFPPALNKYTKLRQNVCDFLSQEFEKPDPSYIPGQPRNFKEAFWDEIQAKKGDPNSSFQKEIFSYTAGDIFMASIDTTSTALEWILLFLSLHPEKQEKLYQEIKSTIGVSRFPCSPDRGRCHYAEAVITESLRHSGMVPFGVWHRAMEDIPDFHGYSIDKDTMIISNIWGVHRDPELWEEPEEWRPERFIGEEGTFQKSENFLAFSSGRRICVGAELARQNLFLFTTSLVQRFQISYPPGKKPSLKAALGAVLQPQPFKLVFSEREKC